MVILVDEEDEEGGICAMFLRVEVDESESESESELELESEPVLAEETLDATDDTLERST